MNVLTMHHAAFVIVAAVACGACSPDLGDCDQNLARTVAYDERGVPAYEGQALLRASCGGDAFCHSSAASGVSRYGVPAGFDFDMVVSRDSGGAARLRDGVERVREWAPNIFAAVESGRMPPFGNELEGLYARAPRYHRQGASGLPERLPAIDSHDGLHRLRNWLACGAPVVERTTPRADDEVSIGDVVPEDARWEVIHE